MQTHRMLEADDERQSTTHGLTISQVARMTGVNAKAIRYYESIDLLPAPLRGANRYRRYSMADINRLILLRRIRCLGVPLAEAQSLLIGVSDARCFDVQQELLLLVNTRLGELDQEIAELHLLRDEMEHQIDVFPTETSCLAIVWATIQVVRLHTISLSRSWKLIRPVQKATNQKGWFREK